MMKQGRTAEERRAEGSGERGEKKRNGSEKGQVPESIGRERNSGNRK